MHRGTQHLRAGGFTIAELAMSMAIMAVLAAIAIPRYGRAISAYRARAAAQRLVHDLARVQSHARMTSAAKTIRFSSSGYVMDNLRDMDSTAASTTVLFAAEPYSASISSINLDSGANQLSFDGYGVPDHFGSITIQSGVSTRTVVIDAYTGKVAVQ